jgi:hypothetical protein
MTYVVLIVVVAVLVGAAVYFAKSRGPKLDPAIRAQVDLARSARKNWHQRRKANEKQIRATAVLLQSLTSEKGGRLASFGGATLYERWIETPQGQGSLIGVKAEAADESSINKRITATRLLTVGVFALAAKKKSGGGNVYVVIDGPSVSGVATMAGDKDATNGPKAFDFAAKVNNAARAAEASEPSRPAAIARCQTELEQFRAAADVRSAGDAYRQAAALLPADQFAKFTDVPSN